MSFTGIDVKRHGLWSKTKPVPTTQAQAKAWLKALANSPLAFHLDDPTDDIPSFAPVTARLLGRARDAAMSLLGTRRAWSYYDWHLTRAGKIPPKTNPSKNLLKAGEPISIKKRWRDPGDDQFLFFMARDENPNSGLIDITYRHRLGHDHIISIQQVRRDMVTPRKGPPLSYYNSKRRTKSNPVDGDVRYVIRPTHIDLVRAGDTILHDGRLKTVTKSNIKRGAMGKTLFGDSYRLGQRLVPVAVITHAKPTKKNPARTDWLGRPLIGARPLSPRQQFKRCKTKCIDKCKRTIPAKSNPKADPSWMSNAGLGRELRKLAKDTPFKTLRQAVDDIFSEDQAPHVESALRSRETDLITYEVARNRRGADALFKRLFKGTKSNPRRTPVSKECAIPKGKRHGDTFTRSGQLFQVISYLRDGKRIRYARKV